MIRSQSKIWKTNHGATITPVQHPLYDAHLGGMPVLKLREDETTYGFAQRLVDAMFARGQGSEWQ